MPLSPREARPKSTPSPVTYAKGYTPFAPMKGDRVSPKTRKQAVITGSTESNGKDSSPTSAVTPMAKTKKTICRCPPGQWGE